MTCSPRSMGSWSRSRSWTAHDVCCRCPADRVRVLLREVPDTHRATGGVIAADAKVAGTL
ncbi:4-oxalocrotonate tautomerase family protein [Streptomyces sp. NPDC057474]|uniref:tautomerase family protein n=1 Tax=Streptomyces sp. NPDC057474 TaxID=3346144 RepID=UPI00367A11E6